MAKVATHQTDFSAGEISPRLRGKVGSELYRSGLAFCENFEVTPQGSLQMRGGTQFVAVIPDAEAVLHTFQNALGEDVVVVIGSDDVSLWNRDGQLTTNSPNFIVNPTFTSGTGGWVEAIELDGSIAPVSEIGVDIITLLPDAVTDCTVSIHQDITLTTPSNPHDFTALMTINYPTEFNSRRGVITIEITDEGDGGNVLYQEVFDFGTGQIPPDNGVEFPLGGTINPVTSDIRLKMQVLTEEVGLGIIEFGIRISELLLVDSTAPTVPAVFPTPDNWKPRLGLIHTAQDTAVNRMFFTVNKGSMYELNYDPALDSWRFVPFVPITDPVGLWAIDQPYTCTILQGRLWLGGTPNSPSTIWGSETWNYDNFALAGSPVDSDPVEFTFSSNGAIQWIEGLKFLLVGTDRGEVIGRSSGPVLTSNDFDFPLEQTWGSTSIQPAEIGSQVMYVTTDAARLRSLYDGGDSSNGYDSEDVSIIAEHLVKPRIVDVTFQKNPDYFLNLLLLDGTIATSTFYQAEDINAWFRHTTNGKMLSMTNTNDAVGTSLWVLTERLDESETPFLSLEVKNAANDSGHNLDAHTVQSFSEDGLLTGLDHLNGYECGIVLFFEGDYILHPSRTPINGEIQLEDWVDPGTALVGIPYTAKAVTLPTEGLNPAGTSQVQKRRNNQVFLRIFDSAFPKINGQIAAEHDPDTPMGLSPALFTGDVVVTDLNTGDGSVIIEQDLPLPTNITAIFHKAKGENL